MKRRLFPACITLILLFALTSTGHALENRASDYIAGCSVSLDVHGNGKIEISYMVYGPSIMSQIGAQSFSVEKYVNGSWQPHTTLLGSENPDFYSYYTITHTGVTDFTGIPGVKYRVTMTAYAQDSQGSDTSSATSNEVTCR